MKLRGKLLWPTDASQASNVYRIPEYARGFRIVVAAFAFAGSICGAETTGMYWADKDPDTQLNLNWL
jgi:hypothetical protein